MFDFITEWMAWGGAWAVALLMFLENVFPPIPSEVVMPLAGYSAATGEQPVVAGLLAGVVGSVAGAWIWYEAARYYGKEALLDWVDRHGRWLTMDREQVEHALEWFDKHGRVAVFLGRMLPTVRTLISVPAGLQQMPRGVFLVYTAAGSLPWVGLLYLAGYLLESQYEKVQDWLNPVTNVLLAGLAIVYVVRVIQGKGRKHGPHPSQG